MVIERLAQSLMLEAPYGPQPDELLIGGAFDLQRQIAFHLQATTVKGLKRTNGLSILQARPFHTDRRLSARNRHQVPTNSEPLHSAPDCSAQIPPRCICFYLNIAG